MISHSFANFITRYHCNQSSELTSLIKQLCEHTEQGSSCIDLSNAVESLSDILQCDAPESIIGSPGTQTPLILTAQNKLYLQRYYLHEQQVFRVIDSLSKKTPNPITPELTDEVEKLFTTIENNDQAQAALCALSHPLTIISGGPGTGKTTTVVKILQLLRKAGYFSDPADCLLLAPTGKAADRLRQSILSGLEREQVSADNFPTETSTIHRALGWLPHSIEYRHHAGNPLHAKVIVIDETSMVALSLMARLLDAIPEDARIILLGDKNQLSSIEVGTVLNDLMEAAKTSPHPIKQCSITLKKSFRTSGDIGAACNAIRDGQSDLAWNIISNSNPDDIGGISQSPPPQSPIHALTTFVEKYWVPPLLDKNLSPLEKLRTIDQFRILTPIHDGPYGVKSINRTVNAILCKNGINSQDVWFHGRSVIVQSNDYNLGIYNGDIGLTHRSSETNLETPLLKVFFHAGGELKSFSPALLPECATAWALTIHRTQGSEYNHILLIIPPGNDDHESKILSRELLYTGLSRAKKSATIWCSESDFKKTILKTVERASGLADMFLSS